MANEITMDVMNRLMEIISRLEHVETAADWITRETVHSDNSISQTSTLITAVADDLRGRICDLVRDLEQGYDHSMLH